MGMEGTRNPRQRERGGERETERKWSVMSCCNPKLDLNGDRTRRLNTLLVTWKGDRGSHCDFYLEKWGWAN